MRQEIDSLICAIGGALFVEIASLLLPGVLAWLVAIVGLFVFVAVLWYAVLRKRPDAPPRHPRSPRAIRTYLICTALLIAAVPLGAILFVSVLRQPAVILSWVVLLAGLHFLPYANAFGNRLFDRLGGVLFVLGVVGGAVVLRWTPQVSAWTGVAAGLVLLGFAAAVARVRDVTTEKI
jgi:hypothetical protein